MLRTKLLEISTILAGLVLIFTLVLQWALELTPCPMCIVQRYCVIIIGILLGMAMVFKRLKNVGTVGAAVFSGIGAFTAAKQSLLQWNPPEFMTCGRDFYGMIEALPLSKLVPSIFAGSGDCASSADNFFGITLANASFMFFVGMFVLLSWLIAMKHDNKTT